MSGDDLSITPVADPDEAAAIATALRAHSRAADPGEAGEAVSWSDRGWAVAARLEAMGLEAPSVRRGMDPWRAVTRPNR